jgi:hypothetical protein
MDADTLNAKVSKKSAGTYVGGFSGPESFVSVRYEKEMQIYMRMQH